MLKLFIAAFSVALLYWLWQKKENIFSRRKNNVEPFITTIEAIEIQTFLDWDTPRLCLESDGIRYGNQFKQKKPPDLPHTQGCKCEAVKLFYTSDDVFQGTYPTLAHKSAIGEISSKDALLLKKMLIKIIDNSNQTKFNDLINQSNIDNFSDEIRSGAISLLERAYNNNPDNKKRKK